MFDADGLAGLPTGRLASLVASNHAELVERETRVLLLAAAWADAHDVDTSAGDYQPLVERARAYGGPGTPEVSEYAAAEFGTLTGTGIMAGRAVIADALDLRHRFPRLWRQVKAGQVRGWQARHIASTTRMLSSAAAADVDEAVAGYVGMLPWPRFLKVLAAAVVDADPASAAARAERARTARGVWSRDSEDGLKVVIARAASGNVVWLMAAVNRIAEILGRDGDTDPVDVRRSKALGVLAQPARALQLLLAHRSDPTDLTEPDEPGSDPQPEAGPDADVRAEPQPGVEAQPGLEVEGEPVDRPVWGAGRVPAVFDGSAVRPRVVLHFHVTDTAVRSGEGVVRPEHGDLLTLTEVRQFLAGTGCLVRVQPVLDPAAVAPVDGYEATPRIRAATRLRHPAEVFPYGTATSAHLDLDHSPPYQPLSEGGPPGQTGMHSLGPLGRPGHRAVTHGGWARRQPDPGTYTFRSPHGYVYLVTNQGTLPLGRSTFADAVWRATGKPD